MQQREGACEGGKRGNAPPKGKACKREQRKNNTQERASTGKHEHMR